ncbi:putative Carboxypeptidase regulatory-like domain-containing protein [Gammaproteobacteria bacterium]
MLHDGKPYGNWQFQQATDTTGHAITLIETGDACKSGTLVTDIQGKIDPQSGQAIVTAEGILFDILARVCGLPVKRSDLDAIRPWQVRLAGVVSDGTRTIQNQIDELMQSAGMAWSAALPGWAMPWPPLVVPERDLPVLDMRHAYGFYANFVIADRMTSVICHYGRDWSTGQALGMVRLEVVGAEQPREGELALPWVSDAWQAESLARSWLTWNSRPVWTIQTGTTLDSLRVGDWIEIDHPYSPVKQAPVTLCQRNGADLTIQAMAASGDQPAIRLAATGQNTGMTVSQANTTGTFINGQVAVTVLTPDGKPRPGANVTLDGSATRSTDANGRASFSASKGMHTAVIEAPGMTPQTITVEAR